MSRLERKDSEISPGTVLPKPAPSDVRESIAPWESDDLPSPGSKPNNYRSELSVLQSSGNVPAINRRPPSAVYPWASDDNSNNNDRNAQMPTSVFGGSFYNDSNENLPQMSPGCAPPGGMIFPDNGEDRRPSIASATTVSSSGSKSSIGGRFHKKLQGFFGDEYQGSPNDGSRQNSETSSMQGGMLAALAPGAVARNRNNSMSDAVLRNSGPPSPSSSRPRTPGPAPSSEVTPWVFQDQVSRLDTGRTCGARSEG